jgi:hypothetical protein
MPEGGDAMKGLKYIVIAILTALTLSMGAEPTWLWTREV